MTRPKSLFVLAGEPSGDIIGADLLRNLAAHKNLKVSGVGGSEMQAVGLRSLFSMEDLSVMGFADVIKRLPLLLWRVRQTIRFIMRTSPDVVVLIDSQEFSALVAKELRKRNFLGKIILYVAPTVWAWRPHRAARIKPLFDEVLAVLPFEPQVMENLSGPPTSFVGHPAVSTLGDAKWFDGKSGKLLLLPGSRQGEISRHLALFAPIVAGLKQHPAVSGFILPTLPHHVARLEAETRSWNMSVEIVTGGEAKRLAFSQSIAALASAGTVSLELALAGVPTLGVYVPDSGQMRMYERAGRPSILLPNIIMGEEFVPELKPGPNQIERAFHILLELLDDPEKRQNQKMRFSDLRTLMAHGASGHEKKDAAERVLFHLGI